MVEACSGRYRKKKQYEELLQIQAAWVHISSKAGMDSQAVAVYARSARKTLETLHRYVNAARVYEQAAVYCPSKKGMVYGRLVLWSCFGFR